MDFVGFLMAAWWAILIALVIGLIWTLGWGFKERFITAFVGGFVVAGLTFAIIASLNSYTTIERGNVGLVSRFGGLTGEVFRPGLNWKGAFVESVEVVDTTQQSYEMSANPETSNAQWTDYTVGSQTSDGQGIDISATTIFRIPDEVAAVNIRQEIGVTTEVVENVVKANVRSITRNTSKLYTASQLYSGDITDFQEDVRKQLEAKFAEQGEGLVLVDFKVRGIKFEDKYTNAVEDKQIAAEQIVTAENQAKQAVFEAQRAKELAIGDAQAEAERAKGRAEAIKVEADANAYAIEAEGQALRRYDEILTLRFIENLNDKTLFLPSDAFQYLLPLPE